MCIASYSGSVLEKIKQAPLNSLHCTANTGILQQKMPLPLNTPHHEGWLHLRNEMPEAREKNIATALPAHGRKSNHTDPMTWGANKHNVYRTHAQQCLSS